MFSAVQFSGEILHGMSLAGVLYITIDRYVAICHPFFYQSHATIKRYMIMVALAWVYKILVPITSGSAYLVFYSCFTVLSFVVIFFCYIRIFYVIAQKERFILRLGRIGNEEKETLLRNKEERRKTHTILILLAIFTASYIPPLVVLFPVFSPIERKSVCKLSSKKFFHVHVVHFYLQSFKCN